MALLTVAINDSVKNFMFYHPVGAETARRATSVAVLVAVAVAVAVDAVLEVVAAAVVGRWDLLLLFSASQLLSTS